MLQGGGIVAKAPADVNRGTLQANMLQLDHSLFTMLKITILNRSNMAHNSLLNSVLKRGISMSHTEQSSNHIDPFNPENYVIKALEDEIRADQTCKVLLKQYHQYLLKNKDLSPLKAGAKVSGTDYFLRDFLIDNRRTNPFKIAPNLIHQFAGNWYIISNLEPNMLELNNILSGISYFASFCVEKNMIDPALAEKIAHTCSQVEYYQQRIDSFNDLSGDMYAAWKKACPLDNV